jgi:hypothetical protein
MLSSNILNVNELFGSCNTVKRRDLTPIQDATALPVFDH